KKIVRIATTVRVELSKVADLKNDSTLDRLPVDIADVYEVCQAYVRLVDELLVLSKPWPKKRTLRLIKEMNTHLFVHLPYHYKPLPRGLERLETTLQPKKSAREASVDRDLQKTLRKGEKIASRLARKKKLISKKPKWVGDQKSK